MEKFYFLEASSTYSGLTKLADQLVEYARKRYNRCIVSELSIPLVVRDLEKEADRLHAANPRCKKPKVHFVINDWEEATYDALFIDDWQILCKKAVAVYQ